MIKPNKYTNIGLSVVGISFEILSVLRSENFQKYNQVLVKIKHKTGEEAKINFLHALSFLYMMGKIHYHPKSDIIELL